MKNTIIIYADDDLQRLTDLRRDVAVAERAHEDAAKETRRFGDDEPTSAALTAAKEAFDAFVDEAAERAEAWVVGNIGHAEFRELLRAHPARKIDNEDTSEGAPKQITHPDDEVFGVNIETFGKALLLYVDPEDPDLRTIVEPTDNVARKVKRLSAGQFDSLWIAAYQVNAGGVIDPKLLRFSTAVMSSAT